MHGCTTFAWPWEHHLAWAKYVSPKSCIFKRRGRNRAFDPPKRQPVKNLEPSTVKRMAQQPHHESLSRKVFPSRYSPEFWEELPAPPEVEQDTQGYQLPSDVITRLRETVFGFDTFFVTKTENYQADGVLFKGNLRGDPKESYARMQRRCQDQLGDDYKLFLLVDQTDQPLVVLLPKTSVEFQEAPLPQAPVAAVFALITLATTLTANGVPVPQAVLTGDLSLLSDPQYISVAVPGTVATFALLLIHEAGHWMAAKKVGAELQPPFLVPAGLGIIGSFGAITGIKSTLKSRDELLQIASAGPAAGSAASLALVVLGLGLSIAKAGPLVEVASSAFNDCFVVGLLAQPLFGDSLYLQSSQQLSPFLLAGWAGLVWNGLNLLPMGQLDGGRVAHAVWGRRAATAINVGVTLVLGLAGIIDSLALYWILFVLFLQRGPISPQQDEVSQPDSGAMVYGAALLFIPLLALLPYPADVSSGPFGLM